MVSKHINIHIFHNTHISFHWRSKIFQSEHQELATNLCEALTVLVRHNGKNKLYCCKYLTIFEKVHRVLSAVHWKSQNVSGY